MMPQTIAIAGHMHMLGKRIGKGGEGEVFTVDGEPDKAVKIYKEELRTRREAKVRAMVSEALAETTDLVAFPSAVATDARGSFIGFIMRLISGYRPIHELYNPKSRKRLYPRADYRFLIRAALNVANAVGRVHQTGCVIGDFNHSGVLLSPDATIALIDADSFQFTRDGTSFACTVGVPDFTPPELHGVDLAGVRRTHEHDNFGLAVAIFHLLAMGKHPYAGRYAGGDISMSEAIAQNRFAFSQSRAGQTRTTPPPGSISLRDFPPAIGAAFEAAFGVDPAARPGATAWIDLLRDFENALRRCTKMRNHYYPAAAGSCVWCRITAQSGIDMFPDAGSTDTASGDGFNIDRIRAQLQTIRLPEAATLMPQWSGTRWAPSRIALDVKRGLIRRKLLGVAAVAAASAGVAYADLADIGLAYTSAAAILSIGVAILGLVLILRGTAKMAALKTVFDDADSRARALEQAFLNRIGLVDLHRARADSDRWITEYQQCETNLDRELANLKATREIRHRDAFLDRFPIRSARIAGVGPAKTATLASYGITTAADVNFRAVMTIPEHGEAMAAKLIAWRKRHEADFRYNPAPDAADVQAENAVRAHDAAKRADLQDSIRSALARLQRVPQQLALRAEIGDPALIHAYKVRAQAEHDLAFLRVAASMRVLPGFKFKAKLPTAQPRMAPGGQAATGAHLTCPKCSAPMRRRAVPLRDKGGGQPWVCSGYPTCNGTGN